MKETPSSYFLGALWHGLEGIKKRSLEMKFFGYYKLALVAIAALASAPARSQDAEIVVTGDVATTAEVVMISPGVASIEMGPLYGVFLDTVPEGVNPHMEQGDVSGKGIAHVAKWRKTPYQHALICWKEAGSHWDDAPACGEVDGGQVSVTINLGDRRNEVFALVPVAIDATTREQLTWVAHPENTQTQLRCGSREDMASVFAIDGQGTITIANEAERARYQTTYCK